MHPRKLRSATNEEREFQAQSCILKETVATQVMLDNIKKAWGVGTPKGFRGAAWIVAFAAFGLWQYMDYKRGKSSGLIGADKSKRGE